jgi:hypothetical protein
MSDKARQQKKHALRRAAERYDLWLTGEEYDAIIRQIQQGECQLIAKQSLRVSIFRVVYNGQPLKVVYDRQRKTIASFLPIEAWDGPAKSVLTEKP